MPENLAFLAALFVISLCRKRNQILRTCKAKRCCVRKPGSDWHVGPGALPFLVPDRMPI